MSDRPASARPYLYPSLRDYVRADDLPAWLPDVLVRCYRSGVVLAGGPALLAEHVRQADRRALDPALWLGDRPAGRARRAGGPPVARLCLVAGRRPDVGAHPDVGPGARPGVGVAARPPGPRRRAAPPRSGVVRHARRCGLERRQGARPGPGAG